LQTIAREQESTLFMALLTALGLLVHRSTGCDDFALGTFVANRVRPEVRRMVGCFVNALPLRIRPGADPTFFSALARVRASVLEAQTLAELPFALLVDRLADAQPLQVVLILHNELGSSLEHRIRVTDTIEVTHQEGDNQGAKRDWTFHLFEGPSGLSGFLEYDTERFDATTAEQTVRDLRGLVESLVRAPDQPLARLALASQGGRS
jgi:non-ribosomal peptide synthetase component F